MPAATPKREAVRDWRLERFCLFPKKGSQLLSLAGGRLFCIGRYLN